MRTKLLALIPIVSLSASVHGGVLYDHTVEAGYSYDQGIGSCDGGMADYGANYGLQVGQLVTATSENRYITSVSANFLQYTDYDTQVWIDVYDKTGKTLIATSGLISAFKNRFTDHVFGTLGVTYYATVMFGPLTPGTSYLISMQVVGPSWAYICRDVTSFPVPSHCQADTSYFRDGSHFGYPGSGASTDWTQLAHYGYGYGLTCMKVAVL